MSITQKLFSFDGRIRRRDWWLFGIALGILSSIIQGAVTAAVGGAGPGGGDAAGIAALIVSLIFVYPGAALGVKRAHDRNRPAIIVLAFYALVVLLNVIMTFTVGATMMNAGGLGDLGAMGLVIGGLGLIVLIYAIYLLIELGFLDGTPGPNRFGPSPKGIGGTAETFA